MLTASLVIYHNEDEKLLLVLKSFLKIPLKKRLFVIDNSSNDNLKCLFEEELEVEYIHTGKNIGFGAGHNLIIERLKCDSKYHIILNPDIYFESKVVPHMINFVLGFPDDIGVISPKIVYPNGDLQHSLRKNPKPLDLIIRRVAFLRELFSIRYKQTHYLNRDFSVPFSVDCVNGCFQLFKTKSFIDIGGFDERYFMYMEDLDICMKIIENKQKVFYYPLVEVVHFLEKGSAKKIRLLLIHLSSAYKYFIKWK